jgi:hypothetical protein
MAIGVIADSAVADPKLKPIIFLQRIEPPNLSVILILRHTPLAMGE